MAEQLTNRGFTRSTNTHDLYSWCSFHREGNHSHLPPSSCGCLITKLGAAILSNDARALNRLLHSGASPNQTCHMEVDLDSDAADSPLDLVTSRRYYHRSDACFLALVDAGADPRLQAQPGEELRNLKDKLMVFAIRPNATLRTLEAVLKLGIADTEWGRDRLVNAAAERSWYHGTASDGREVWTMQNENLQAERQRIILEQVPLSEEQKAQFWSDDLVPAEDSMSSVFDFTWTNFLAARTTSGSASAWLPQLPRLQNPLSALPAWRKLLGESLRALVTV